MARRLTAECLGRRLTYPDSHNSKGIKLKKTNCITLDLFMLTQHRLIVALSQGPGTADGGDQVLDVIGISESC